MLIYTSYATISSGILNNYPAKSRGISPDTWPTNQTIFRKIEQDNCFIIQQIVNETLFVARITVVVRRFERFRTNLGDLRISQDICYR